jgi:hypothetical protein
VEGHGEIFKMRFQRERLTSLFVGIVGGVARKLDEPELAVVRGAALPFLEQRRRAPTRQGFHEGRIVQETKSTV